MTDSVLPIPPEIIGSMLVAIATIVGTILSIRYIPLRNRIMMKNFWQFVTTRQNIRNILGLEELEEKNFRYRRIFILGSFIPALAIIMAYQLTGKSPMFWSILFVANIACILITLGFYLVLPLRLSEKTMNIYKICRIPVYAIITSGTFLTFIMFTSEPNLIYFLLLAIAWFVSSVILDYFNWSFNKELFNKLISNRLKENYEKMPIFHFLFKTYGNIISGKFRAMNKEYLVIRDEHEKKDIMIMWKDLEVCSIDSDK